MPVWRIVLTLVLLGSMSLLARSDDETAEDAAVTAALVGRYVEQYFARAQHLLAEERVTLQPLTSSMDFAGFPRRLIYELRVEWDPFAADDEQGRARIVRQLMSAGGPMLGPPSQPDCLDPKTVSPEPLGFLLPDRQESLRFEAGGTTRIDGREVVRLNYRPREVLAPTVDWEGECGHISLAGRMRGRVWADPVTGEILRWDERLIGIVDLPGRDERGRHDPRRHFTIERVDTTVRYGPVRFESPDEILLLPVLVENTTIIRNSGMPRLRTTRSFSNYRRFLTGSRLLVDAAATAPGLDSRLLAPRSGL